MRIREIAEAVGVVVTPEPRKGSPSPRLDEATFKAEWPKVVSNCGGCHKEYRKPPAKK